MEFITISQIVLYVAEKYNYKGAFYRHANHITSANDAVANDVKSIEDAGQQQNNRFN